MRSLAMPYGGRLKRDAQFVTYVSIEGKERRSGPPREDLDMPDFPVQEFRDDSRVGGTYKDQTHLGERFRPAKACYRDAQAFRNI